MSTRVHELAKELGIPSKDLVTRLTKLRVPVKGPMSVVDEEIVAKIRQALAGSGRVRPPAKPAAPAKTVKPSAPAKPAAAVKMAPAAAAKKPAAPAAPAAKPAAKPAPAPLPVEPKSAPRPTLPAPTAPVAPKAGTKPKSAAPPAAAPAIPAPVSAPAVTEPAPAATVTAELKLLKLNFPIVVKDLASKLELSPTDLIKRLMKRGVFASITQSLDQDVATQVAQECGFQLASQPTLEERLVAELAPDPAKLVPRAPVVTFMGHVDHGKTSLLDAIRQSKLVEREAGGITQHIGAYEVVLEKGRVTFLDTPGHEAFTALRARGANVTDAVVLVVAADDGVMPQTVEAMDHAKAAGVPILVAMNKVDKAGANVQRLQQQLTEHGLLSEEWGGKVIMVPVSAKTGQGIDRLLEMLLLEAELLELRADPTKPAQGTVIDARLSKDRGALATVLVQQGTLRLGDLVVVGTLSGRVRAMSNDLGQRLKEAPPSTPVEILGLPGVAKSGDRFMVVADDKAARTLVEARQDQGAGRAIVPPKRITLDELHQRIVEGTLKELKLVLKADVQGSLEAITQSLGKLPAHEVKLNVIHVGVGDISESDVMLAAASDAVVIGFHVGMDPRVQVAAVTEGVDVRIFQIIYEVVTAITAAIEGLLEPKIEENFLGRAEIRRIFQISKVGMVAGCMVTKGSIRRDAVIRVIRGKAKLWEGKLSSLKRVKDDVREVQEGLECGIGPEGFTDLQLGDLIEAWELKKVARKLA